jgi:hypothetical protein
MDKLLEYIVEWIKQVRLVIGREMRLLLFDNFEFFYIRRCDTV